MPFAELFSAVPLQGWIFIACFWAAILSLIGVLAAPARVKKRAMWYIGLATIMCSAVFIGWSPIAYTTLLACGTVVTIVSTWWPNRVKG